MLTGFTTLSQTAAAVVEAALAAKAARMGWKGRGRGQGSWQGRWQRGAMEWWTEPSDWSSTGGGDSRWEWNDDDSSQW